MTCQPPSQPSHPAWGPSGPSWSRAEVEGLVAVVDDARRVLWRVQAVEDWRPTADAARRAREALGESLIGLHDILRRPPVQPAPLRPV